MRTPGGSTTARLAAVGVMFAVASVATTGVATAQQDPINQAKAAVLCEPAGSLLRPTQICAVYDPASETYSNPYTPNGDSPGLFGLGVLGLL